MRSSFELRRGRRPQRPGDGAPRPAPRGKPAQRRGRLRPGFRPRGPVRSGVPQGPPRRPDGRPARRPIPGQRPRVQARGRRDARPAAVRLEDRRAGVPGCRVRPEAVRRRGPGRPLHLDRRLLHALERRHHRHLRQDPRDRLGPKEPDRLDRGRHPPLAPRLRARGLRPGFRRVHAVPGRRRARRPPRDHGHQSSRWARSGTPRSSPRPTSSGWRCSRRGPPERWTASAVSCTVRSGAGQEESR